MLKRGLYSILIFVILSLTGTVISSSNPSTVNQYHFPLVVKSIPDLGVIVTYRDNDGMVTNNYISGYVQNRGTEPYYSTLLEVDVISYPYCDPVDPPSNCEPYFGPISLKPAFSTTLPGQINPFFHSNLCYKACIYYYNVRVAFANNIDPDGVDYLPLEVINWDNVIEDDYYVTIMGTIRNDSDDTLQNLRLVLTNLEYCFPRESEIVDSMIKPGRRTTFQINKYKKSCLNDNLVFVGQGEVLH